MRKNILYVMFVGLFVEVSAAEALFVPEVEVDVGNAKEINKPHVDENEKFKPNLPNVVVKPRLQIENHKRILMDVVKGELVTIYGKTRNPEMKLSGRNVKIERERRVGKILRNGNQLKVFNKKILRAEEILKESELIYEENEKMKFISSKINLNTENELEQSIYVGDLYLMLALYYFEEYSVEKDNAKVIEYLNKTKRYAGGVARLINLLKQDNMRDTILANYLESDVPFLLVHNEIKEVLSLLKGSGIKTEKVRLEYVLTLNAFVQYVEETNQVGSFKEYDKYIRELNKEYNNLSKVNRYFNIVELN